MSRDQIKVQIAQLEGLRKKLGIPTETRLSDQQMILATDLEFIAANIHVTEPVKFKSHRPILGGIIVFIKDLVINRIMSKILMMTLSRQFSVNQYTYVNSAAIQKINQRLQALEDKIKCLEGSRD